MSMTPYISNHMLLSDSIAQVTMPLVIGEAMAETPFTGPASNWFTRRVGAQRLPRGR
jgi:hypothetical protein